VEIRVAPFAGLTAAEVYDVARLRQDVFVVEQECPYPDAAQPVTVQEPVVACRPRVPRSGASSCLRI